MCVVEKELSRCVTGRSPECAKAQMRADLRIPGFLAVFHLLQELGVSLWASLSREGLVKKTGSESALTE